MEKTAGPALHVTTWKEQNYQLMRALNLERVVTVITIGLIEIVAALNIFITLVMMVMEKYRDIAVLMSMGARHSQIRWIFMLQGVLIGVVGSAIGLTVGLHAVLLRQQVPLDSPRPDGLRAGFVPFEPRWIDGVWIAGAGDPGEFPGHRLSCPQRHADRARRSLRYE